MQNQYKNREESIGRCHLTPSITSSHKMFWLKHPKHSCMYVIFGAVIRMKTVPCDLCLRIYVHMQFCSLRCNYYVALSSPAYSYSSSRFGRDPKAAVWSSLTSGFSAIASWPQVLVVAALSHPWIVATSVHALRIYIHVHVGNKHLAASKTVRIYSYSECYITIVDASIVACLQVDTIHKYIETASAHMQAKYPVIAALK